MGSFEEYAESINTGFELKEKNGVKFLSVPAFNAAGKVSHGFSTRIGGVSEGVFESLNFSLSREKNKENIIENFKRLCLATGVCFDNLCLVNYAHGDGIYAPCKSDRGKGLFIENDIPKCDALIIDKRGIAGATMHADCVPVFVMDKKSGVCCASHAGWRGVCAKLPQKLISRFESDYSAKKEDILVGIGPHIMSCCFEVQSDAADIMEGVCGGAVIKRDGRLYADLKRMILRQLYDAGIPGQNVTSADMCTFCNKELFFSHRRDKGKTGAMASVIEMK